ncbi:MAG: hypothetical protein O3A37_07015 [Planctomycetota bacterium]|nr:hypothetical protein [Planctomycetota bacterium]
MKNPGRGSLRTVFPLIVMVLLAVTPVDRETSGAPPGYRSLAPGALTVITADTSAEDTLRRRDLSEVTVLQADMAWTPKQAKLATTLVERAKQRDFQFDVWCLEFAFKMPRLIAVNVPVVDAGGQLTLSRKRCWYLVYRVKNVGWRRTVVDQEKGTQLTIETFDGPIRFMPHFVLESLEGLSEEEGISAYRAYLDRLVPSAMPAIRQREDPARRFLDSASMAEEELAPGEERWGVAVWEDVDPRIDYFSIYVRGLTNAIDWKPRDDRRVDDPTTLSRDTLKSLRLDFWRPGDTRDEVEEEMNIGYAGIFERTALGVEVLNAFRRPELTAANPVEGLATLTIDWADLVEPSGGAGVRILPLTTVLRAAADLPVAEQPAALRAVVGDLGVAYLDELLDLVPKQQDVSPLVALASVLEDVAQVPDTATRRQKLTTIFGAAARRVDWLARETILARQVVALDATNIDPQTLAGTGPQQAFEIIVDRLQQIADPATRQRLIEGLFGPRGAALYAEATKQHEGIDHAWVFRYEIE